MMRTGILAALRAEGLTVVEVNGWQTRGRPEADSPFDPHGSVNHHTAGAATGNAPSLGSVTNGRPDLAGPLANVLQSRQVDAHGLDVVYLVAAGRANHAGEGGWKGLVGNASVWGLEVEHVGTPAEPFPAGRLETTIRVHTAFARCSKHAAAMACQHYEWAGPRKVDFLRAELDPFTFRAMVGARLAPPAAPVAETPTYDYEEDAVHTKLVGPVAIGSDGNGWTEWDPGFGRAPIPVGAVAHGPYPPTDGYWYADAQPQVSVQQHGNKLVASVSGARPGGSINLWLSAA